MPLYTVKKNDTLALIAKRYALPLSIILAFNKSIRDPNMIYAGQVLHIPNLEDIPTNATLPETSNTGDIIQRATSAISKGIRYQLGKGGVNPKGALPTSDSYCDCSGFVCWVLGLSRKSSFPFYKPYGGYIYTDSMVADINSDAGIFEKLNAPEEGCIVVYGAGNQIGHVGVVSKVIDGAMKKVIHCSKGNDLKFKDAIQETTPTVFNRADSLWARFSG